MAFELKFKEADVKRLKEKIDILKKNCSTAKNSPVAEFVVTLADQYGRAIQSVMGVVSGEDGGSATSTPFFGTPFSVGWLSLSERTLKKKHKDGLTLEIWKATGKTQKAVKSSTYHVPYKQVRVFAGIDKGTDEDAWLKAMNNEYGLYSGKDGVEAGFIPGPKRALFTLANEAFRSQQANIIKEIRRLIMVGVDWGKT